MAASARELAEMTIRPYRDGDEHAIQEAFRRAFGVERSLAEWRWKFPERPYGRRILLGFDPEGELLCQYAAMVSATNVFGRRTLTGHIVDAFSLRRESLARHGLFQETVHRFFAEYAGREALAYLCGLPSRRHLRVGLATLGYPPTGPIWAWRSPAARPTHSAQRTRWLAEGFDRAAIDELWARAERRYPVALVRDAAAWERRFSGRPAVDYRHLGVRRGGRAHAWGVLRREGELLRIVDLVWDGEDRGDLAFLLDAFRAHASEVGATSCELWLRGDAAADAVLAERGFAGEEHPEVVYGALSFDAAVSSQTLLDAAYVTLGDSDLA